MKSRTLWAALLLVLVVNGIVLTGVVRNRSGVPDAVLTLTERELPVNTFSSQKENSGVELRLNWNRSYGIDQWFNADKLVELGIKPSPVEKSASFRYALPKKAYVVLEYEGAVWRRFKAEKEQALVELEKKRRAGKIDEQNAKSERYRLERALHFGSRLFAVDAGLEPGPLRQRYPDKQHHLIAATLVRESYGYREPKEQPTGWIDDLLIDRLHVPRNLHEPLLKLPPVDSFRSDESEKIPRPRYEVRVNWGRRYEPWVMGVTLLEHDTVN